MANKSEQGAAARESIRKVIARAVIRSPDHHSLLCVHVCGITDSVAADLNKTLAQVAQSLGGPVTLAEIDKGDFALFLAGWPMRRARQVARLIRAVTQHEKALEGRKVCIGVLPIWGEGDDIDALLESAKQLCRSDSMHQINGFSVEVVSNKQIGSGSE